MLGACIFAKAGFLTNYDRIGAELSLTANIRQNSFKSHLCHNILISSAAAHLAPDSQN